MKNFNLFAVMHAVGIHSAMAIKRQRKRRDEQRRAKERRYSIQSSESGDTQHSPHGSTRRKNRHQQATSAGNGMLDTKVSFNINFFRTHSLCWANVEKKSFL